jgi:hypothetical protein
MIMFYEYYKVRPFEHDQEVPTRLSFSSQYYNDRLWSDKYIVAYIISKSSHITQLLLD